MSDRKGKARAWSAKRALNAMIYDPGVSYAKVQMRHLAKAYLAGIKAAREIATGMHWVAIGELVISEQVRLGMSPQAKRKGKSGEGRDNA